MGPFDFLFVCVLIYFRKDIGKFIIRVLEIYESENKEETKRRSDEVDGYQPVAEKPTKVPGDE